MRKLTSRQIDVLGVVESQGPLTARDVGEYHLPIGASSARSRLGALERKGFVAAVYTGWGSGFQRARGYRITDEGAEALAAALDEWQAEEDARRRADR